MMKLSIFILSLVLICNASNTQWNELLRGSEEQFNCTEKTVHVQVVYIKEFRVLLLHVKSVHECKLNKCHSTKTGKCNSIYIFYPIKHSGSKYIHILRNV